MTFGKTSSTQTRTLTSGDSFGELALLHLAPRTATVRAVEKSSVWVIDRDTFRRVVMQASAERIEQYARWLDRVPLLQRLLQDERAAIARALMEVSFQQRDVVLQQGEVGNAFFILFDGEVSVREDGFDCDRLLASQKAGTTHYFGERALLNDEPRTATITVESATASALVLERADFDALLGPLQDILRSGSSRSPRCSVSDGANRRSPVTCNQWHARKRITLAELEEVGVLGVGGFATVFLCQRRGAEASYALKKVDKAIVKEMGLQQEVLNEKNILMTTASPFIVRLHETYRTDSHLYFLLEAALGGDLYGTYSREGIYGSEKHAYFYSACTTLALEHLHQRRIIYRDLKPENLLLDQKGYVKLTDMGLATFVVGLSFTICGTPDYFAPEVISSQGYMRAYDWWMLGILIFELMFRRTPFKAKQPMQMYRNIRQMKFSIPQGGRRPPSDALRDLLESLIQRDPTCRLPMRPGGVQLLQQHTWYKDIDWDALRSQAMDVPYAPEVKDIRDLHNFLVCEKSCENTIAFSETSDWDREFATADIGVIPCTKKDTPGGCLIS